MVDSLKEKNNIFGDLVVLLKDAIVMGASDIHTVCDCAPQARVDGALVPLSDFKLDASSLESMCYCIIDDFQIASFEKSKEFDFAVDIEDIGRFRVNYYFTIDGKPASTFRFIPYEIPTLNDVNAPSVCKEIIKKERGLVLITGPTGSGKSTTLAAMLNEINFTQNKHIITIEDPVEFLHKSKKSLFSSRNIGSDTLSFASALKHSLRQDPDVIFVGELRDKETVSTAITAAETGHLVFSTLHTNSAYQTINRIIDSFDGSEQMQIRNMLSSSLSMIISQTLVPKIGGGRVVVHEIFINNLAFSNLIRENKIHQIHSQMQLNQQETGVQTQAQGLYKALKNGYITEENAFRYSTNSQELINLINSGG